MTKLVQPKVGKLQGGAIMFVKGADGGQFHGQVTASGALAQHATIADVSVTTIVWTTADKAKVNTIIAALEDIGVLATS